MGAAPQHLAVIALAVALLSGGLAVGIIVSAPPAPGAPAPALLSSVVGSASGGSAHPDSTPLGGAERTLVMYNQTLFDYNASATSGTIGQDPGLAFDSENDTAWATGLSYVGASTVDVFNPATGQGIRQMAAGGQSAIAYDNRTNTMWVSGGDTSANVTVFDASTYAVLKVIGTGGNPRAMAYDWRTRAMYVVNEDNNNVSIINDSSYKPWSYSISVGGYSDGIAFDPASGNFFVSEQLGQTITGFYQTGNGTETSLLFSAAGQMGTIIDDPQNGMVYAVGDPDGIIIIDAATNMSVGLVALPHSPNDYPYDGLAVDTADGRLYVSQIEAGGYGNVVSYEPAPTTSTGKSLTNTSTGFNSQPETLAYDPTDARILVCDTNQYSEASSNVSEISTASGQIVASVGIQRLPMGSVYDPSTEAIYVYDGGTGDVYEIGSGDQIERSAFVGYTDYDNPDGVGISGQVAYDSVNASIFVDWYAPDAPYGEGVAEFSAATLTFLRNWTTGISGPSGIAYDSHDHTVYVANYLGTNVTVISMTSYHESWLGTGQAPIGVVYDGDNDGIYVASEYDDNVTVINGTTHAIVNVNAGDDPWGELFDPANGYVYVANYDSGDLTVINGATNTTLAAITIHGVNGPTWLTYDTVNETILAAEPGSSTYMFGYSAIALVNATNSTYFGQMEYGFSVWSVVYDPGAQTLFAIATYPGAVYQILFGGQVSSPPPPVSASLQAVPSTIALGQTTDFETDASGGTLPYTYTYSTPPEGCTSANETPLPCTPTVAGTYYVGVNVTDPTGGHAAAVAVLLVTPTPATLTVGLAPDPSTVALGGTINLVTSVSGGTGTGSYTYAYSTLPAGECPNQNVSTLPCAPADVGTYYVGVNVTDADGNHGAATAVFSVTPAPPSLTATLTPAPTSIVLGNSSTLTVAVQGTPVGPLTYSYTVLPAGCTSSNRSSIVCTPTGTGTFPLTVEVHDSAGHFAEANSSLVVTSPSPSTPPGSNNSGSTSWVWVLLAVIVIAAILIVLFVARRRKTPTPPPNAETPSAPPAGPS